MTKKEVDCLLDRNDHEPTSYMNRFNIVELEEELTDEVIEKFLPPSNEEAEWEKKRYDVYN